MRVTIIPEDKVVIVDGVAAILGTLEADENIHAIQWNGDYGTIEYKVGAAARFIDISIVEPFVTAHTDEIEKKSTDTIVDEPVIQTPKVLSCSPWQIRKALNYLNLRQAVEATVSVSNDQTIKDGWEYATSFVRTDPFVVLLGSQLGKTDAELDALFELAVTL